MATTLFTPSLIIPNSILIHKSQLPLSFSVKQTPSWRPRFNLSLSQPRLGRVGVFRPFAAAAAAQGETVETNDVESEEIQVQDESDGEIDAESSADGGIVDTEEEVDSVVMITLQSYKEALINDDQSKIAEIESFLMSIEDEKNSVAKKLATLSEEQLTERDRVLRISADFDNFRKRTERERVSLMSNVQGEVVESLLPVLDNFERAKAQLKLETEGEQKINNSYQSIYKQFSEILSSLGVVAVETVGSAFDPLLHEAIMQEDSVEFEEGIIIQEFRKGFKLGERLLRPAMVKVSSGPGPAKAQIEDAMAPAEEGETEADGDED